MWMVKTFVIYQKKKATDLIVYVEVLSSHKENVRRENMLIIQLINFLTDHIYFH